MGHTFRRVAGLSAVAWGLGCTRPRTEIVATVTSQVSWGPGQEIQTLSVEVRTGDANGPRQSLRFLPLGTSAGLTSLPFRIGILPTTSRASDDPTPVWIEALGCAGTTCTRTDAVVSQRAIVQFANEGTLDLQLVLAAACVASHCTTLQRCDPGSGRCVSAQVTPPSLTGAAVDSGSASDVRGLADVVRADAADAGPAADVAAMDVGSSDVVAAMDRVAIDVAEAADVVDVSPGEDRGSTVVDVPIDVPAAIDTGPAMVCTPGTATCTDSATRSVCNGDGRGFTASTCPSGTACAAGTCAGGPTGEITFSTPGTSTWTVPAGVGTVAVVVVGAGGGGGNYHLNSGGGGGGALCYALVSVTPGAVIPIVVGAGGPGYGAAGGTPGGDSSFNGTVVAHGGGGGSTSGGGAGGSGSGGTCFSGGAGGALNGVDSNGGAINSGGGGAGGYAGNGGTGAPTSATACATVAIASAGSGGGGGGGGAGSYAQAAYGCGGGGGGVGIHGLGANGTAGMSSCTGGGFYYSGFGGGGGSGGSPGTGGRVSASSPGTLQGGSYGGGGGAGAGGDGAIRVIWGPGRSFPDSAS